MRLVQEVFLRKDVLKLALILSNAPLVDSLSQLKLHLELHMARPVPETTTQSSTIARQSADGTAVITGELQTRLNPPRGNWAPNRS